MLSVELATLIAAASTQGQQCTVPNVPAAVRAQPPTPSIITDMAEHGIVTVVVTLAPAQAVPEAVALSQTSGNTIMDAAAITVARHTRFDAEQKDCSAVGGEYFYDVEF